MRIGRSLLLSMWDAALSEGNAIFPPIPPPSQYTPPGELLEGYTRSVDDNPFTRFFERRDAAFAPPDRMEVDLEDPTSFDRQMYDQVWTWSGSGLQ